MPRNCLPHKETSGMYFHIQNHFLRKPCNQAKKCIPRMLLAHSIRNHLSPNCTTISRTLRIKRVQFSRPSKRIRGKRARRWINTKTSVTHDQAVPSPLPFPPSSAGVSLFLSPPPLAPSIRVLCARRHIGIVYILQDVHLDQ